MSITKSKYSKKEFVCPWCGKIFDQQVRYEPLVGSSQVKCFCGNFIPTSKKQFTGNVVGRKHIHLR